MTLHEEELEALSEFHAYHLMNTEWIMSVCYGRSDWEDVCYRRDRLDALGCILGQDVVRRIVDETSKKVTRRAAWAKYHTQTAFEKSLQESGSDAE